MADHARQVIEVLAECDHPLVITTKSDRVLRDLDLLAPMAAKGLAAVAISVTSLDPGIAMTIEPRAPHPERRLTAVRRLADAGVPVFVNMAPIIPAITDDEIEAVVARAAESGATRRVVHPHPASLGGGAAVPRLARRAFPRARGQGDGDDPVLARRARQRSELRITDAWARSLGGIAACALPARAQASRDRSQFREDAVAQRPVSSPRRAAGRAVLTSC